MQRVQPRPKDEIPPSNMRSVVEWAQQAVGNTTYSQVLARWPEVGGRFYDLYRRMFEEATVEPYLLELMRIKSGNVTECEW